MLDLAITCTTSSGALDFDMQRTGLQCAPETVPLEIDLTTLSAAGFTSYSGPGGGETYDERYHKLDYKWEISDILGNATKLSRKLSNWDDMSTHYGPFVAHTFPTSGLYDVTLTVTDPATGSSESTTKQITILSMESVYSGKIYVVNEDADSDFTGKPTGATEINASDFSRGVTAYDNAQSSTEIRAFLFKKGSTFTSHQNFGNTVTNSYGGLYFGSYGTGAKPIINVSTADDGRFMRGQTNWEEFGNLTNREIRITGLDFQSTYDPTTTKPTAATGDASNVARIDAVCTLIVHDCKVSGFKNAAFYYGEHNDDVQGLYAIVDTEITNYGGSYPIFQQSNTITDVTCVAFAVRLHNPPTARSEIDGYRSPIRYNAARRQYVALCDIFSSDPGVGQPALKLENSPFQAGALIVVNRNYLESCAAQVSIGINTGVRSYACNAIIEGNICVGSFYTNYHFHYETSGVTTRNNLAVLPRADKKAGSGMRPFINHADRESGGGALPSALLDAPSDHYGNTLVSLRDETENADTSNGIPGVLRVQDLDTAGTYTDIDEFDNLRHVPNSSATGGPITTYAPLTSTTLVTLYSSGWYDPDSGALDVTTVPADSTIDQFAPDTDSTAIGAAVETLPLYRDLSMAVRSGTPNIGCW